MVTRLISAGIGLVVMALVMFTDQIVLTIAISIISSIAVWEALRAYDYKKYKVFIVVGVIVSVVMAWADYFPGEIVFVMIFAIIVEYVALMLKKHKEIETKDLFTVMFLTLIVPLIFSTLGYIRRMEHGVYLVWLPFVSAWLTDSFAYFGGKFLGRHQLCPDISPKKTVEGAIIGVMGAVLGYIVYAVMLNKIWEFEFNIIAFVVLAVVTSVLSQMGDLFASCMKRENDVKDFGNLMPGHGGVLDRFDSLMLTTPCIFIFLKIFILIS